MNKGQGLTMGMVLAAALLLRPSGSAPQSASSATMPETGAPPVEKPEARDGPWVASCNYWAPVRQAPSDADAPADIRGMIGAQAVELRTSFGEKNRKSELACSSSTWIDRWGFPQDTSQVDVTAFIAIISNPVHTHMALSFDRSIDAILQAATDNGYVSSTFWLPWSSRGDVSKPSEMQGDFEPHHDSQREREPGLIVLRQAIANASFYKVVFLFVVGETTTQGVDGAQVQRVFQYEAALKTALHDRFRTGKMLPNGGERIAIIGPNSSASAVPLVAAIRSLPSSDQWKPQEIEIAGDTGTSAAVAQLNNSQTTLPIHYFSFGYDGDYSRAVFENWLCQSGYTLNREALLVESNSFYSYSSVFSIDRDDQARKKVSSNCGSPLTIKFPREVSLLRNTEGDSAAFPAAPPGVTVSPYLRFSVKDRSIQDGVPIFSRENTPLSQEAQLMMISRELQRSRVQFVAIGATNPLDTIFLAQFLHRAVPEATLVFWNADLLTVREIDSVPFVGSLAVSPYLMVGLGASQARSGGSSANTFPSSPGYAFYNAASYTFWHNGLRASDTQDIPLLRGYGNPLRPGNPKMDTQAPPLWVSAIGRDGYYPLGILSPCSSGPGTLPSIHKGTVESQSMDPVTHQDDKCAGSSPQFPRTPDSPPLYPGRLWSAICILVLALCLIHSLLLLIADYQSPITRDLAITQNDQQSRRSIYIRAASATLLAMAWAAANPVLTLDRAVAMSPLSVNLSFAMLGAGLFSLAVGAFKTGVYIYWRGAEFRCAWKERFSIRSAHAAYEGLQKNFYFFLNLFLAAALAAYVVVWDYLCSAGSRPGSLNLRGLAFDYRCLNPGSGISPLPPVVILMFGWYIWGFFQTRRLRFSPDSRPILPLEIAGDKDRYAYVSDEAMSKRNPERPPRLYDYITRLMTIRQLLHHFPCRPGHDWLWRDVILTLTSAVVFVFLILRTPIRAVDHFLWPGRNASLYEILLATLLYPLVAWCISGWLRMFLIWHTLKRDLLDRLEDLPLRFAFSRLKGLSWMTMIRRGGPHQQDRDIARSVESMHQLVRIFNVHANSEGHALQATSDNVAWETFELRRSAAGDPASLVTRDLDYRRMHRVEEGLAEFSRGLLSTVLIPYWRAQHVGFVQSKDIDSPDPDASTPTPIHLAEEFLAIRYVSAIGAVLGNLRDLMFFVSVSFVLAFLAWNSCTFQPRQWFDWLFTVLLAVLGCGVIGVFAQMHRNTILSRITDTKANELGWDFYLRVASFGALPVVTWLAYQFPDLGSLIFRFVEPAVPVVK